MLFLLAALAFCTGTTASSEDSNISDGKSGALLNDLRRQLMLNNYDYSLEDSNDTIKGRMRTEPISRFVTKINNFLTKDTYESRSDENIFKNKKKKNAIGDKKEEIKYKTSTPVIDLYAPKLRAQDLDESMDDVDNNKSKDINISKKDLLYYIDDENLNPKKDNKRIKSKINLKKDLNANNDIEYKFLKVKHQYRRSGQSHLIEEIGKDEVAIVNLDKGPFPELRLPPSRRQYMQDRGEIISDEEEIPPPSLNSDEPEAAPEGVELAHTKVTLNVTK